MELLVIVALVGILAGLAIPNFLRNWQDERLNSANKQAIAWLDDLRRKAIQQSSPCRVVISTSPPQMIGSCDSDSVSTSTLNLTAEIPNLDQLTFELVGNSPSTWVFTPRGTTLSDGHFSSETVMRLPSAPSGAAAVAVQSARTRAVFAVA